MNEQEKERELLKKMNNELNADLEHLAPSITGRLQESRRKALDLAERKPFWLFSIPRLIPVGGFATLAVVAAATSLWFSMRPPAFPHRTAEDIEILIVQGNLEMYKDLEFFQLLAQAHEDR